MGRRILPFFGILLLTYSCDQSNIFHSEKDILNREWSYKNVLSFELPNNIEEPVLAYLVINHSKKYRYQNLYLKLYDNDKSIISIQLATKTGDWLGDCDSKNCILSWPIYSGLIGKEIPQMVQVTQHSRDSLLAGINKIGLTLRRL